MRPIVRFTDVGDGSFALSEPADDLEGRRSLVTEHPVTWLTQVHGDAVVNVIEPGDRSSSEADAAVTSVPGAALSVITADCAPVLLASPHAVAAVHAGWKGLFAGVLAAAVTAVRGHGDGPIRAWLGPCIRPRCYEFGGDDLDLVATAFGDQVRALTAWGTPALDVPRAVRSALGVLGVEELSDVGVCTACSPVHYSHRARGEAGRQAAFIWLEP